jgi:hypothetical protein
LVAPGGTSDYSYAVTNTGSGTVSSIAIVDDTVQGISCPGSTLGAGETMTCTGSSVVTVTRVSVAYAVGVDSAGDQVQSNAYQTTVTVGPPVRQAQSITFGPLPDVALGIAPINLTATASSGLPVSYDTGGPCSVSGSSLTMTGVGTCTVTASQAGNPAYEPATPIEQSFAIVGGASNGRIAYTWTCRGPGNQPGGIALINPDGSNSQVMFPSDSWGGSPQWSSDGTKLTFGTGYYADIWTMNADGSNAQDLTRAPGYPEPNDGSPIWTPDGRILFVRDGDIWLMNLDGTDLVQLTHEGTDGSPAMSPDGRLIAYWHSGPDNNNILYLMNRDGTGAAPLFTAGSGNYGSYAPSWSPDGKHILGTDKPRSVGVDHVDVRRRRNGACRADLGFGHQRRTVLVA